MISTLEKFGDKGGMQGVTRPVCNHPAKDRLADQREIAKKVEDLVADEFVGIPEGRFVQHSVLGQNNRILERAAAHKTAGLERLYLMVETERTRGCNQIAVIPGRDNDLALLMTDQRMLESDLILDAEVPRRIDRNGFALFFQLERFRNSHIVPFHGKRDQPDAPDRLRVWLRAAVKNRNLEVVEFDVSVVDAERIQSREQMF